MTAPIIVRDRRKTRRRHVPRILFIGVTDFWFRFLRPVLGR